MKLKLITIYTDQLPLKNYCNEFSSFTIVAIIDIILRCNKKKKIKLKIDNTIIAQTITIVQ